MKTTAKAVIALAALGASAWIIIAQDTGNPQDGPRPPRRPNTDMQGGPGGPGGPGMRGGRPMIPPVVRALDVNRDGIVDADEIANASAALKTLDKNGDGKLTMDELMGPPPPPQGVGGYPGDGQGPGNGPQPRRPRPNAGGNFDGPPGPPPGDQ